MRVAVRVLVLGVIAVAAFIWAMGGVSPAAARLIQPDVTTWPAGDTFRRAGLAVIARRPLSRDSLVPLVRLAHTLPSEDETWPRAIATAARVLNRPLDPRTPAATLAQLDEAAASALGLRLGPLGVLEWRPIDPYFVTWLDDMAGTDASLAAARFNRIGSRDGLPTAEWYITEVGRAFVDRRPVPFVLIADTNGRQWAPRAYPPDQVPQDARRIAADTLGETLIVGLWSFVDDRPDLPTADVVGWWAPIAKARGLPSPAPSPQPPAP